MEQKNVLRHRDIGWEWDTAKRNSLLRESMCKTKYSDEHIKELQNAKDQQRNGRRKK